MAQTSYSSIGANQSGTQYRTQDNNRYAAALTQHSGSSRPSYAVAGTLWLNTAATPWVLYMYDGTDDISLGTVNATTNAYAPANAGDVTGPASSTANAIALFDSTTGRLLKDSTYTITAAGAAILDDADAAAQRATLAAAGTGVANTFTGPQRGTATTDNDLSFDLSVTNNFTCTPAGTGTLTFTNHAAGQSGMVLLDNSGGYAISAAATTKINSADLTAISAAGVYLLSYYDNGTNAYVVVSKGLTA